MCCYYLVEEGDIAKHRVVYSLEIVEHQSIGVDGGKCWTERSLHYLVSVCTSLNLGPIDGSYFEIFYSRMMHTDIESRELSQ